jgi:hypothetical protein
MWEQNFDAIPSKGVEHRYPALQDVTMSFIGIPASASASVAALMQADLVPVIQAYRVMLKIHIRIILNSINAMIISK